MPIVLSTATAYIQRATNEIVLNINHQKRIDWTNNLCMENLQKITMMVAIYHSLFIWIHRFDPVVPAKLKFVAIDESVLIFIENCEHLLHFLVGQYIDMTFIIAKQCTANQSEFYQRQQIVTGFGKNKNKNYEILIQVSPFQHALKITNIKRWRAAGS